LQVTELARISQRERRRFCGQPTVRRTVLELSWFRAFCLKFDLAIVLISLTYASPPTAALYQASAAESPVALPPISMEPHMPHYTPSISAIERPHPVRDSTHTLVCLSCGDTMKHLRTLPKFGVRPEKLIFVCPSCKGIDTKEAKRWRKGASVGTLSIK
jgi:hypothetical protein